MGLVMDQHQVRLAIYSEEELGEASGSMKDLGPFQRAAEWNRATGAQLTGP